MASFHSDTGSLEFGRAVPCQASQPAERDALYRVSDVIVNTGNLVELLDRALDVVLDIMHLEMGAIYLYDRATQALSISTCRGLDEAILARVINHEDLVGIVSQSVESREPIIIEYLKEYPLASHALEEIKRAQIESLVCLPLVAEGAVVGVLMMLTRTCRLFIADDVALLKTLANQLAAGIRKASLFQEVAASEAALRVAYEQLKHAQAELVQRERLAVLGRLSSSIGHELRNPLGVIRTAVYYLSLALPSPHESVREALNMIDSEVARANKIISDLLDFAQAKPPCRERVSINAQFQAVLKRTPIPPSVTLMTTFANSLPAVIADGEQLQQVFHNLIINALQAMPDGGRLRISTCQSGNFVEAEVCDTGVGIPPENRTKIFEPFFTTKPKGIGLGLAISKSLVEANGGEIILDAHYSPGTRFVLRLPAIQESRE